jgi:hypothetical protein
MYPLSVRVGESLREHVLPPEPPTFRCEELSVLQNDQKGQIYTSQGEKCALTLIIEKQLGHAVSVERKAGW